MGLSVGSNNGVPKVDTWGGTFLEHLKGRVKVAIDGVGSDKSSRIKWVEGEMGLDNQSMQLFGSR